MTLSSLKSHIYHKTLYFYFNHSNETNKIKRATNNYARCLRLASQQQGYSLILEDDVQFADTVHESLDSIPDNWDVVYFGGNHAWGQPTQIDDKIAIANRTLAMHCVAIRNTVYEKMLNKIDFLIY